MGHPTPYCALYQLFVTKWYDQSGGQNHITPVVAPVTAANMPVLAVIDGEPRLLFGNIGTNPTLGTTSERLQFPISDVTVAACCQPFVTAGPGTLFSTSSIGDAANTVMLTSPKSVAGAADTILSSNWLVANGYLGLAMPSAPFRLNKTSLTMSSGAGAIEVGAGAEVFSTSNNPFALYPNVSGTGIVLGSNFFGYIDTFMVKSGADSPMKTQGHRTSLDCAFGVKVDESYNFVIDGDSSGWGYAGVLPHVPGSDQGQLGYGLSQFYMAGLCKHGRFNNIGTSNAQWSDYQLRAAVVRNLWRPGATNVVILHNDGVAYTRDTYAENLALWVSSLGAGWTILVVDIPEIIVGSDLINQRVRSGAAQGGYTCISSMSSTSYNDAIARCGYNAVWASSHLSPVGFSVMTKPEIAGLSDFLRL